MLKEKISHLKSHGSKVGMVVLGAFLVSLEDSHRFFSLQEKERMRTG